MFALSAILAFLYWQFGCDMEPRETFLGAEAYQAKPHAARLLIRVGKLRIGGQG